MNKLPHIALTLAAVFSSFTALAQDDAAQNKRADFNVKLQAGSAYASTLTVASLDQTSSQSDWANVLYGRVGGELYPTERITLKGSYSMSSRKYHEYSDFNQDLRIGYLDAALDLGGITWGVSRHVAHAKLASEPLLELTKNSLYAARLFSGGVYIRGAYTDTHKSFENNRERNADGDELAADVYYFFNNTRTFWSIGVSREVEQANSPAFDNNALKLRARYSHTGELAGRKSQIQLGWRYQNRDYDNEESLPITEVGNGGVLPGTGNPVSPAGTGTRHDRSHVVEAVWALSFVEWLTLETKVEHGKYNSNLDAADYRESGVSALLTVEF
ncbi:hypothetical protein [Marinimicrobium sp. ABcell2]|uniref:hypothetical protein n=1 Tax=Marinimicrobium sp. ABcell2 TaxID=3069751 RepID=UPI0027B55A23|nr:hypothetical protein [Marinimicrobium sp. ABcell2]MDQ2076398.1 hypothetical protein [Marinimicrobium sp. ABcell2]